MVFPNMKKKLPQKHSFLFTFRVEKSQCLPAGDNKNKNELSVKANPIRMLIHVNYFCKYEQISVSTVHGIEWKVYNKINTVVLLKEFKSI